jgi:hypothetical protein
MLVVKMGMVKKAANRIMSDKCSESKRSKPAAPLDTMRSCHRYLQLKINMELHDYIKEIRQLISKDEIEKAIFQISKLLDEKKKVNEIIIHSARFNDVKKQITLGVIDFEKANITKNQIRVAILEILDDLENKDTSKIGRGSVNIFSIKYFVPLFVILVLIILLIFSNRKILMLFGNKEIKFIGNNVLITDGKFGKSDSTFRLAFKINTNVILPDSMEVYFNDFNKHFWHIEGFMYDKKTKMLELYVKALKRHNFLSGDLILNAFGFKTKKIAFKAENQENELNLEHLPPISIERAVLLESDNKEFASDIILTNSLDKDIWVEKISILGLGTSNNICNPNPIATIKYNISLTIKDSLVIGNVKKEKESLSIPVKGYLKHKYCDGVLMLNYFQTFKIPAHEKISYIPVFNKLRINVEDAVAESFKDTLSVPRLGISVKQLNQHKKLLSRNENSLNYFTNTNPSYYAPLWSSIVIIFHLDDGQIIVKRILNGEYASDMIEDAVLKLQEMGFSEVDTRQILMEAYWIEEK